MNMALVTTAVHSGAVAANYVEAIKIYKREDAAGEPKICGARLRDCLTGDEWDVQAKGVVNATGPFTDGVRQLDDPQVSQIVAPSSGIHITLPKYYSPGSMGLIDPASSDGRVIFFLPWEGNAIAGTTDAPSEVSQDPMPREEEIQWILDEIRDYLSPDIKVRRGDVLSAWSGIRPLVRNPAAKNSESLVRNHLINVSPSGLLTIAGGKWTTYRAMAEETVDEAVRAFGLQDRVKRPCQTSQLKLLGAHHWTPNGYVKLIQQFGLENEVAQHLHVTYGDRAWAVCAMAENTGLRWPVHGKRLDPLYPYIEVRRNFGLYSLPAHLALRLQAEVRYACRQEYAAKATDVIARRTRLSFLNATAALEALPRVIEIMASELGWSRKQQNQEFVEARDFLASMGLPHHQSRLSFADVRKGRAHQHQHSRTSRAIFSADELEQLRQSFTSVRYILRLTRRDTDLARCRMSLQMDHDRDGVISETDLAAVMRSAGYADSSPETVRKIIAEVDRDRDGFVEWEDYLQAWAGAKEASLQSAFSTVINDLQADPRRREVGSKASEDSPRRWFRRSIPEERSGGGV